MCFKLVSVVVRTFAKFLPFVRIVVAVVFSVDSRKDYHRVNPFSGVYVDTVGFQKSVFKIRIVGYHVIRLIQNFRYRLHIAGKGAAGFYFLRCDSVYPLCVLPTVLIVRSAIRIKQGIKFFVYDRHL